MINSQDCRCNETNNLSSKNTLKRIWSLIKGTANRYKKWEEMKHNQELLLTMDDRMLKDIGLSRADAVRISNATPFWKFMIQSESNGVKDQSDQKN